MSGDGCDLTGLLLQATPSTVMVIPARGVVVTGEALVDERGGADGAISVLHSTSGHVAVATDSEVLSASRSDAADELARYFDTAASPRAVAREEAAVGVLAALKCTATSSYVLKGGWSAKVLNWEYNPAGQPGANSLSMIQLGANRIANGTSSTCGNLGNGLAITYRANTTQAPGVTATPGCGASNGNSTVGWGAINDTKLAYACWWNTIAGYKLESDIRFDNSSRSWFISGATTGCTGNTYDLISVAAHEVGHAVGLDHPTPANDQTMRSTSGACDPSQRELGRGDQNGLRALYGG